MIGEKIQNYRIAKLIGEGGMATVYEAVHQTFEDRKVAIKILNPILTANKNIRQRFVNEAKIMASLTHPNIVHVHDFEERNEMLAIVMELLNGYNLSEYLKKFGKPDTDTAKRIFSQVLDAFNFAHKKNVVHRYVKPSNIFILKDGTPKILDFGIAKLLSGEGDLTTTGVQLGTLTYMSPEQVKDSKHIDHRSDIYSLGVTLYYLLAGQPAYSTQTMSDYDIRKAIVETPFPKLLINKEFQHIIDKATAKNPNDRFLSCQEFKAALLGTNKAGNDNTLIDKPNQYVSKPETDKDKTFVDKPNSNVSKPKTDKDKTFVDKPNSNVSKPETNNRKPETNYATDIDKKIENTKKRNRIFAAIGIIVLLTIALFVWKPWKTSPEQLAEQNQLDSLRRADSTALVLKQQRQDSIDKAKADSISYAQNAELQEKDNKAWNEAKRKNTKVALEKYIADFPQGTHIADAKTAIENIGSFNYETVYVSGGTFQMRSTTNSYEQPVHSVTVSSFNIGKYEVTQAQWKTVMGNNPAKDYGVGDNYPVYYVSWDDIQFFLQKLKQQTGKTYRLPTEAEWEYAAGGGNSSRTKWSGTDSEGSLGSYAWFISNSGRKTHPVGSKSPNRLGIYDMSGNVWEWCQDKWHESYTGAPTNGTAWTSGNSSGRVDRGGSWSNDASYLRVADRGSDTPGYRGGDLGFRLVFVP